MVRVPGAAGAGPIWHNFMETAHADWPVRDFSRPSGIVEYEISANSGARPSERCPERKEEVFAKGQPPLDESHDWYQMVKLDAFTGLRANEFCPDHVIQKLMLDISGERGREWIRTHVEQFNNLPLAPLEECGENTGRPRVLISEPTNGATVQGIVPIFGTVQLPNFDRYEVQYGLGSDPQGWGWVSGPHQAQVEDGLLTRWDTSHLSPGVYTLRIRAFDREQHAVETRVQIEFVPPTATPTWTPSPTPEATSTPLPTSTPPPSPTPVPSATPKPTPTRNTEITPTSSPTPEVTATKPTPTSTPE
jgi:hypothetical protein